MGSERESSKKWRWGLERVFTTLEVTVEGVDEVDDSKTISPLDEDGEKVVVVVKRHP